MKAQFFEQQRREMAILAERVADGRVALARVWHELTSGQVRIVDSFLTEERCYLLLSPPRDPENYAALPDRRQLILQGLLCGETMKGLAFDLRLSQSTVSQEAKSALQHFGIECRQSQVSPLLAMCARAARDQQLDRCARIACFSDADRMFRVVGAARVDVRLAPMLPPAEFAVVRALFEGRNYLEIATNRGTSTRTVANQLAAVFRKLGVSGRGSLLNHMLSATDALS